MAKKFDKILEKATDSTLLEPHWDAILECVDMIRAGEVPTKGAIQSVRKRIRSENPHSALHALLMLDACVKNCGAKVHQEVATMDCMEDFKDILTESKSDEVRKKAAEMLQCWANAFAARSEYKIVVDTHNLLKLSGFDFPPLRDADAMYVAQVAPEWVDAPECFRCRTEFSLFTRKHHCRACGQIFCDKCSSKQMLLPHLGIEKEVRVCDTCFEKGAAAGKQAEAEGNKGRSSQKDNAEKSQKEKELREKEEEELQLALAISQSEAEAKEQERQRRLYSMYNGDSGGVTGSGGGAASALDDSSSIAPSELAGCYRGTAPAFEPETTRAVSPDDPLAKYLDRGYWEKKKEVVTSVKTKVDEWDVSGGTAPPQSESSYASVDTLQGAAPGGAAENGQDARAVNGVVLADTRAEEEATTAFCTQLKEQITIMDNRIRSSVARGRSIVNDSAIQALFMRLTNCHAEVLHRMAKLDEERASLENMQDHLAHIKEARDAVTALREEHTRRERERAEAEQRARQAQMHHKLEIMRQKKHEMLLQQRHQALLRFQQQEQEAAARRAGGFSGGAPGMVPGYGPGQAADMSQQFAAMQLQQQQSAYMQQPHQQPPHYPPTQQGPPDGPQQNGSGLHAGQVPYAQQQYAQPHSTGYAPPPLATTATYATPTPQPPLAADPAVSAAHHYHHPQQAIPPQQHQYQMPSTYQQQPQYSVPTGHYAVPVPQTAYTAPAPAAPPPPVVEEAALISFD